MARPAPAATRALAILDLLAANPDDALTLSEIAKRLSLGIGSAHALLHAMVGAGYLTRHPISKSYSLGPAVVAIGNAALDRHPVIAVAREEMRVLAEQLGVECMAAMPFGDEIVIVGRAGRPHPHRPLVRVGDRRPLVPPLGIAYLAWSSADEIERWLQRLGPQLTAGVRARHEGALAGMRLLGYTIGVERDGEPATVTVPVIGSPPKLDLAPGRRHPVAYIAATVFDDHSRCALVIYADGFPGPMTVPQTVRIAERIRNTALVLTRMTGGTPPGEVPGSFINHAG